MRKWILVAVCMLQGTLASAQSELHYDNWNDLSEQEVADIQYFITDMADSAFTQRTEDAFIEEFWTSNQDSLITIERYDNGSVWCERYFWIKED